MNTTQILRERLKIINEVSCVSDDELIHVLRRNKLISTTYDKRNVAVDKWFLTKGTSRNAYRRSLSRCEPIEDPHSNILLQTIIWALIDVTNGRPCDLGIWRNDLPPGRMKCRPNLHICSQNAESYLHEISSEQERFVGLKSGTVMDLMNQLKQSTENGSSFAPFGD